MKCNVKEEQLATEPSFINFEINTSDERLSAPLPDPEVRKPASKGSSYCCRSSLGKVGNTVTGRRDQRLSS